MPLHVCMRRSLDVVLLHMCHTQQPYIERGSARCQTHRSRMLHRLEEVCRECLGTSLLGQSNGAVSGLDGS